MTDATDFSPIAPTAKPEPASVPLPAPVPFGVPVVIADCATPLGGETLLSLLWKRLQDAD